MSPGEIARNKISNLSQLFGADPLLETSFDSSEQAREVQRRYVWSSLGLLQAGWVAVLIWVLRKRKTTPGLRVVAWLLPAAVFDFVVWSAVLFGPRGTDATHSSFADLLLLGLALAAFFMAVLPRWCRLPLAAWAVYNLFAVWAFASTKYLGSAPVHVPLLAGAVCIAVTLLWFGFATPWRDREETARTGHGLLPAL